MADPLPASRFYAVPLAGRMECPQCSYLIIWGVGQQKSRTDQRYWNPVGSVLTCPQCKKVYHLGLLAWPGGSRVTTALEGTPSDQVPNLRQLAELRQRTGGWWVRGSGVTLGTTIKNRPDLVRKGRKASDPVNRYIPEGCTCGDLLWSASCQVHGGLRISPSRFTAGDSEDE